MNVKKQIGNDRCNGVSGALIFDGTTAIIENCLYSNGTSIANISGNSKCEATNILSELYSDQYLNPTDKDNNTHERYNRSVGSLQHYFMVWKNSTCEYILHENNQKSASVFTYDYNIEDSSVIDNKTVWVYIDLLADVYWHNTDKRYVLYSKNDPAAVGWYSLINGVWTRNVNGVIYTISQVIYTSDDGVHHAVWRLTKNGNVLEDGGNLEVLTSSVVSTIYQDDLFEVGSYMDFPKCNAHKVPVSTMFDETSEIILSGSVNDNSKYYLDGDFSGCTSCIQIGSENGETESASDKLGVENNDYFVVWSSFLYTDGNYLKWSEFPNVEYNVNFRVELRSGDWSNVIDKMNKIIPKNLNGKTLTISFVENVDVGIKTINIKDFYNGNVVVEGNSKTIKYADECGIKFENIQFLKINNLIVLNKSNIGDVASNPNTKFNHCAICKDIDNLEIYNCTFNNKFLYPLDNVLNASGGGMNSVYKTLPINAVCLDNIKLFNDAVKTVGLCVQNSKGCVIKTKFIDCSFGIMVDQNSNIYFTKRESSDYCVFKRTSINTNNMFKHLCCFKSPMVMFYVTGNSKVSTNIKVDSPISYNPAQSTNITLTKYSEFVKNENFVVSVCDPGSLFDHDYTHADYNITDALRNNTGGVLNKGGIVERVTIFVNEQLTNINLNNNLILTGPSLGSSTTNAFVSGSNVTSNIANDWYWYYNVGLKPNWVGGSLNNTSFVPIDLHRIVWTSNDNEYLCGYRCVMLADNGNMNKNGILSGHYKL